MTSEDHVGAVDFAASSSIDAILDSDVDGLLDAPEKPVKVTATDRLERAFLEVVEFRRTHGRIPDSTTREIAERKLGARLDGILANEEKIAALKHLDEFGLLEVPEAPASIDDLLGDDDLDLLGLDEPIERPLATHAADAVTVAVEIDPNKLAKGIAAATSARLEEIMK